jgi:hypothetical protein
VSDEKPKRSWWAAFVARKEGISTVVMGLAAVLTTWCAYESTKWKGIQTIRFNEAAASRVESTRNELAANQLLQVDVMTFLSWAQAVRSEVAPGGLVASPDKPYQPSPTTLSGFLFERFRKEFRPAVGAWIATRPLLDPSAPPTPFVMKEYPRTGADEAERLLKVAEEKAASARAANQISDNYMLTTVINAFVVFFAGLSTKTYGHRNGVSLLVMAWIVLFICTVILFRLPVVL